MIRKPTNRPLPARLDTEFASQYQREIRGDAMIARRIGEELDALRPARAFGKPVLVLPAMVPQLRRVGLL